MVAFDQQLTELHDLLRKADVLARWDRAEAPEIKGETRVGFSASLKIRADQHARPAGAVFAAADLELDLTISPQSAVTACSAQVRIDGLNTSGEDLRFAMHFDRHDGNASIDLHSQYHWQIGGHGLDGLAIGGVLILEGPRFPWHPIDPILLTDFVLGHFHGEKRTELMSEPGLIRYARLLKSSQIAFVAPFFAAVSQALSEDPAADTPLWPSICCH